MLVYRLQRRIATGCLNFSDRPFNSCDPSKIKFCLIKPLLSRMDPAPRRLPIWNPVRSAVATGRSMPDTWIPERQLYWNPECSVAHTLCWDWSLKCEEWCIGNICRSPIVLHTGGSSSYWLFFWRALTIGPYENKRQFIWNAPDLTNCIYVSIGQNPINSKIK
jgi:hypothetical protein